MVVVFVVAAVVVVMVSVAAVVAGMVLVVAGVCNQRKRGVNGSGSQVFTFLFSKLFV